MILELVLYLVHTVLVTIGFKGGIWVCSLSCLLVSILVPSV